MIYKRDVIADAVTHFHRRELHLADFPDFVRAAVLIPLVETDNELSLILTMRTHDVETHKGQVSFPGGMQDPSDVDAIHTAIREAEEELGIKNCDIDVIGMIDDFPTPTKFIITPVVGFLKQEPTYALHVKEVEEVFTVPLSFFADRKNGHTEEREILSKTYTVWHFRYGNHHIWGATAAIIMNLIDVVR